MAQEAGATWSGINLTAGEVAIIAGLVGGMCGLFWRVVSRLIRVVERQADTQRRLSRRILGKSRAPDDEEGEE